MTHASQTARFVIGVSLVAFSFGCGPTSQPEVASEEPWSVADYAPPSDGLRVLVIHDMEGLAGQSDPSSFDFGTELYPTGQEWLVADVNAVVDGLFAGGATEVLIADGH